MPNKSQDLALLPPPKWNILYQDATGKFKNVFAYSDEERDKIVADIKAAGGIVHAIYERTR